MKITRKLASIVLALVALFFIGAILGSAVPNVPVYTVVAGISVAALAIGMWYYYGHKKEMLEDKASQK